MVAIKTSKNSFPSRLQLAVKAWDASSKDMKRCRKTMLKHYANGWFSGGGVEGRSPMPINLIDRGVQVIAPFLVSHNPRVMINPRSGLNSPAIKSFARTLELAMAHLFDEIRFAQNTLRPVVIDALFSMGITKTGVMKSHTVEIEGFTHDIGQPYCDRVDFDDYIGDIGARNHQEMKMEGNYYRLPLKYVQESGLYKNTDKLRQDMPLYGEDTSPEGIAKPNTSFDHELHRSVRLMDVYLPMDDVVVTLEPDGQDKFMREVEWDGPEGGPYDTLCFKYFPDSTIPIPPVYVWLDLNKAINQLTVKMKDESLREKTVGVYNLTNTEDAQRIQQSGSGEMVGINDVDSVKELTFGGFNDKSFPFLAFLLAEWSKSGPNMNITGGKVSEAQTLGQEQMMQANAQRELDDMAYQTYDFTRTITKKLAWFLWSDPLKVVPVVKRIAGIDIQVEYSEAAKEGEFFDYTFDVEPYSMTGMNPEMRYQRLLQFVTGYILPTAQIAAQQGTILDVPALAQEFARYLNINNLDDWYKSMMPMNPQMNPYQMIQGEPQGVMDGRMTMGSQEGSNMNNLIQQQTASAGKTTKEGGV